MNTHGTYLVRDMKEWEILEKGKTKAAGVNWEKSEQIEYGREGGS